MRKTWGPDQDSKAVVHWKSETELKARCLAESVERASTRLQSICFMGQFLAIKDRIQGVIILEVPFRVIKINA